MSNVDVQSRRFPEPTINPDTYNATVNGEGVNVALYHGSMAVIDPGTITDGTHTPKLEHSDDNASFSDVPADEMQGAFVDLVSDEVQKVGYSNVKRWVRVTVTVSGATTGGAYESYIDRVKPGIVGEFDLSTGNTPVIQGPP